LFGQKWLRTSETGNGYATESAEALLKYAASGLGLNVYSMQAAGNQKKPSRTYKAWL
jgi:hypothetical protein